MIKKILFGTDENKKQIYKYEVSNKRMSASFGETGAAILSLVIKDKNGIDRDVVLGPEKYEDYRRNWPAFGAVIGRYANRISKACFELNGITYKLKKNIPGGCLHSGFGYQFRDWDSDAFEDDKGIHVLFRLKSEDNDQGFPGNLNLETEYILSEDDALTIHYRYISDKDTAVNLTNHCYFNLLGHDGGTVLDHNLMIFSDKVTQVNRNLMPNGTILSVQGSAFDFTAMNSIRENMKKSFAPYCYESEYDINYVLSDEQGKYMQAAKLEAWQTGLGMNVYTDMPGMQFYTGNAVKGFRGKGNVKYDKYPGVCFETQFYPDAINIESFPSPVIRAGEQKHTSTRFEFYHI
ncbi:MAG: galactose mutarotase [Lachnospiraceae bacterium]|nr:galactose mutarotase [Lachnospiraceae bacterium]